MITFLILINLHLLAARVQMVRSQRTCTDPLDKFPTFRVFYRRV